eukprot:s1229_g11.t2
MAVWRRFGEEIHRHRILDTTRCGKAVDPRWRSFVPSDFIHHMEEHRKDVAVILERHWRDYIVSEVLDKMSEVNNFFIENPQKHLRQPLHRVLRKFDLILSAQMRWFVQMSLTDWVEFVRSFTPKVNEPLPTPLLTLSLEAVHGEVQIAPHPDDLKMKILELIDDVTKVTSSIMSIEYEARADSSEVSGPFANCQLVPFCNLPQHLMLQPNKEERKAEVQLLRAAKAATAEVIEECLHGPRQVQASYQEYAYLFKEEVAGDMDPLDVEAVREKTDAYLQAGTQIEKLMTEVVKFPLFELHCMDRFSLSFPTPFMGQGDLWQSTWCFCYEDLVTLEYCVRKVNAINPVLLDIIQQMSQRAYHLAGCCLQTVAQSIQERSQAVLTEWHETHEHILSNPEDEEETLWQMVELAKLKQFMSDLPQLKTKPLMQTTRHIHTQINMLADFSFQIDNEVVERAFSSFAWPLQIQIDVGDSERSLDSQKQKFMEKLDQEKTEYERDMASYQEDLEWLRGLNDYSLAMKCAHRIYSLKDCLSASGTWAMYICIIFGKHPWSHSQENLEKAVVRVQSFVDRERLFGMEVSDYSAVEAFEPYYKLWNSAIDFKHSEEEWLQGVVQRLVAEEIEAMVEEQYKESYKTMKQFEGNENPLAVAKDGEDLREEISNFRANMPVIRALCQEAFEPRHFSDLFEELRMDMDMEDGITLQQMLEIGILDHIDTLERISVKAQKEHGLKTALATMKKEWRPIEFGLVPHRAGTHMVRGIDEIQAVLDDHIVKSMGIRGSPFVEPIEKEVKDRSGWQICSIMKPADWLLKLTYIQDLLEQWLAMQRSWLPIFSSDDIQKQLPSEAKRFQQAEGFPLEKASASMKKQVNILWRTTMESVAENPNVLDVSEIENLLASFIDANKKLDAIQKGLNDYLDTKRLAFPRFFFLLCLQDELLMILSQTKDPTAVQPHMGKCFEGISRVRFNNTNEIIEAMSSVEGEVVELAQPVNVVEGEKKGNVEKWLMEVQGSMIDSLTKVTGNSLLAYAKTEQECATGTMADSAWSDDMAVDVCIIGGGLAGLTALEHLAATHRCVLLEASARLGGRLRSRDFCGRKLEEGANWVQGLGKNPIWTRARECNLQGHAEDDEAATVCLFRGSEGPVDVTKETGERMEVLESAQESVEDSQAGKGSQPDLSLADALAQQGWPPAATAIDMAVEFLLVDFEYGESPDKISVKHNVHEEHTRTDFGEETFFVDDPRGFGTIAPAVPGSSSALRHLARSPKAVAACFAGKSQIPESSLRSLAAEVVTGLCTFRPGTGAAGSGYAHALRQDPTGRLASFLEDEILARSSTLDPKAIANLSGLLYGSGAPCKKNRAVMQLRQSAMQKLQAFSAPELVDLASGLANSRVMDEGCLQTLRKRMDAAAGQGDSDGIGCSRHLIAACESDWPSPCPGILADLETAFVLSKPPGWSCATSVSGKNRLAEGRKRPPTISHYLQRLGWERPVSQDPAVDHGLVHRLDLETSGALLAAKTFHSYWRLRLDFSAQDVRKRYLALVHGFLPRQWQRLDMPLQLQRIPHSDSQRSVRSKSVVNHDFGRSAETGIRAIAHLHGRGGGPMSLLLAEPRTGRTHQIRSHVSHIGHPIVGDSLYATSDEVVDDSCQRVFLHCFALNFLEPAATHDDHEP